MKSGSSPLTRGKPRGRCDSAAARRLIPAHAGKTSTRRSPPITSPAHPRSRGENLNTKDTTGKPLGSSPLTRGKPKSAAPRYSRVRLIPAHAGKTDYGRVGHGGPPAHPRSRGENYAWCGAFQVWGGSSPLTRGKRLGGFRRVPSVGLIPAHAGKTRRVVSMSTVRPAHPRSRGENPPRRSRRVAASGSSPLTRGKLSQRESSPGRRGLIPAHAGKTRSTVRRRGCRRAHPRSRGENIACAPAFVNTRGSSPLTRGKLGPLRGPVGGGRLIPAHAGKTST